MRVLIGVDGSPGAFAAIRFVARLLSNETDRIALYYSPPEVKVGGHATEEIQKRALKALAETLFREASAQLPESFRKNLETILGEEPPQHSLVTAAEQWRAELIVLGARGVGPLQRLLVGSVAKVVAHTSNLPVLVVRTPNNKAGENGGPTQEALPQEPKSDPLRVLFACDGSQTSNQAGQFANKLHWPPNTKAQLITVIESLLAGDVPEWLKEEAREEETELMARAWVEEHEKFKQEELHRLEQACLEMPGQFHWNEPLVVEGHPSEQILKAIEEQKADLVVLGARGRGAIARFLLGSTSDTMLNHAPCSVLIVRKHGDP